LAAALALAATAQAAAPDYGFKPVAPENLWVIETGKGRILIELRPDLAPNHVARIRELTREGYYDGALFYRVINHYFAQGGARSATGPFESARPNVKAEFTVTGLPASVEWLGASPLNRTEDGTAFARFCPGTAAFPHYDDPDSANSQFHLMREAGPSLEHKYTVFGRVVVGLDVVRALNVGEPPASPDLMVRVRVAADIPQAERPAVEVADTAGAAFRRDIEKLRKQRDKARLPFSLCDVPVPARVR
jgi:peptidylprolyl isomerase